MKNYGKQIIKDYHNKVNPSGMYYWHMVAIAVIISIVIIGVLI